MLCLPDMLVKEKKQYSWTNLSYDSHTQCTEMQHINDKS